MMTELKCLGELSLLHDKKINVTFDFLSQVGYCFEIHTKDRLQQLHMDVIFNEWYIRS